MNRVIKHLPIYLILIGLVSCHPSFVFRKPGLDPVETFTVLNFENASNHGPATLEARFTNGLKAYIHDRTKLIEQKEDGDLEYSGKIVAYEVRPASSNANGKAIAQRLTVTVQVHYLDNFEGKKMEREFSHFVDFDAEALLLDQEDALLDTVFREIYYDILNQTKFIW